MYILRIGTDDSSVDEVNTIVRKYAFRHLQHRLVFELVPVVKDAEFLDTGTEGAKGFVPGQGAEQFLELVIAPRTGKIIHDPETFLRVFRLKLDQFVSVKIRIALRKSIYGQDSSFDMSISSASLSISSCLLVIALILPLRGYSPEPSASFALPSSCKLLFKFCLHQHHRRCAPAREEDGARGRPRGLVLCTFPRTYAFPTKFHGDSIAHFRDEDRGRTTKDR